MEFIVLDIEVVKGSSPCKINPSNLESTILVAFMIFKLRVVTNSLTIFQAELSKKLKKVEGFK